MIVTESVYKKKPEFVLSDWLSSDFATGFLHDVSGNGTV